MADLKKKAEKGLKEWNTFNVELMSFATKKNYSLIEVKEMFSIGYELYKMKRGFLNANNNVKAKSKNKVGGG